MRNCRGPCCSGANVDWPAASLLAACRPSPAVAAATGWPCSASTASWRPAWEYTRSSRLLVATATTLWPAAAAAAAGFSSSTQYSTPEAAYHTRRTAAASDAGCFHKTAAYCQLKRMKHSAAAALSGATASQLLACSPAATTNASSPSGSATLQSLPGVHDSKQRYTWRG
jgi:hypothetical protein